ncbi:DUF3140 domain-containing protein [Amycolatopsis viridis]|uniref:DNA-binding protein n=1 Tax=Amycolatopsis viridis TaxID=185678 RepID=A0ABX0SW38_9PSEU|nr:DUF3140 domain-containing protein [Amycolatopsis viridis]NIH81182.1 hypothetical protein [Amycolatopsis viridis]
MDDDTDDKGDTNDTDEIWRRFRDEVNMTPKELEDWLETDESKQAGQHDGGGESVGHSSGRRIVQILRSKRDDLGDEDYQHMRKVLGYLHRHRAQRPSGDVTETKWRYSLMNWGHDPLR